eukprot:1091628-Prymnesium_polylepis.1
MNVLSCTHAVMVRMSVRVRTRARVSIVGVRTSEYVRLRPRPRPLVLPEEKARDDCSPSRAASIAASDTCRGRRVMCQA